MKSTCHILFVEDNLIFQEFLRMLLTSNLSVDYHVHMPSFRDRQSAREYILRHHQRPDGDMPFGPIDVAILDYQLPDTPATPDSQKTFDLSLTKHCVELNNPPMRGVLQLSNYVADERLKGYWKECAERGVRGALVQKDGSFDRKVEHFVRTCLEERDYLGRLEELAKRGLLDPRVPDLGLGTREGIEEVLGLADQLRVCWPRLTQNTQRLIQKNYFDVSDSEGRRLIEFKDPRTPSREVGA